MCMLLPFWSLFDEESLHSRHPQIQQQGEEQGLPQKPFPLLSLFADVSLGLLRMEYRLLGHFPQMEGAQMSALHILANW